jgi:hypothetical protein
MEDTEHTVEYVKEQCIIGCPEHPKGNTMTAIDIASFKRKEE